MWYEASNLYTHSRVDSFPQGVNAEFQFHFENLLSNNTLPFNISSNKVGVTVQGIVSLAETLDFEATQTYKFLVSI